MTQFTKRDRQIKEFIRAAIRWRRRLDRLLAKIEPKKRKVRP